MLSVWPPAPLGPVACPEDSDVPLVLPGFSRAAAYICETEDKAHLLSKALLATQEENKINVWSTQL